MAQELKDTLRLPKTEFPMRANLVHREPARLAHWEKLDLYDALQKKRAAAPVYVLHDGPPFTNGDVHIGTAMNKTLKDIINRYKSMRGFRTPYVPGWDCHGLPIEQKVTRELQEQHQTVSVTGLRRRCDEFSEHWIRRQTEQFQRLGVLGDWPHQYKTKSPAFEAVILRTFAAFIEQGLVYRAKKPVYWSIPFETALAEAEIEYKDHVSPSIWVKFPVPPAEAAKFGLPTDQPLFIVIWTTTPWTLPANLAIAVNPAEPYRLVRLVFEDGRQELVIVAQNCLERFLADLSHARAGVDRHEALSAHPGESLQGLQARHPFIDRPSPVVLADYVTPDSGTGCVHTAPGHGVEDYLTGLKYHLEIYCPVGDEGRFVDDGRVPADLVGLTTLETVEDLAKKRTSPANLAVLKKLEAAGALLAHSRFTHSYPHCWRSKTPIVFRAVDQWFVSLDKGGARRAALDAIGRVEWIPAWGEARIRAAVESRPDWCISRQRAWGVPIPAFFDSGNRALLDAGVVRGIADQVETRGTSLWFESTPAQLLDGIALPADWPAPAELTRGRDTLDVWFDSGSTHAATLKSGQGGTRWPADLYLEGSDQHRGWFQSSLWTAVIALGGAPYRTVLTHGFIVDEDRKKISKSASYEKPRTSDAYVADYGADVIRLWIASQDFRNDIPISQEILSHVGETYRTLRNTFRFQLANLYDFDPIIHSVPVEHMDNLDRWALHRTAELARQCTAAFDAFEFHRVYQLCNQFCAVTLSATYHDILKDRLYTLAAADPLRRSSQTAIHRIFHVLAGLLAPVIPFTTDEAWSYATANAEFAPDSLHLQDWPAVDPSWIDQELDDYVTRLLAVKSLVNEKIEALRNAGTIGKSLQANVALPAVVPVSGQPFAIETTTINLSEFFLTSGIAVTSGPGEIRVFPTAESSVRNGEIVFESSQKCPRCWRELPAGDFRQTSLGNLCSRCAEAIRG